MVNNFAKTNKTNNHLSHQIKRTTTSDAGTDTTNVADLNQLTGSQHYPLENALILQRQ